jgi:NAD-dependent DNA ligase
VHEAALAIANGDQAAMEEMDALDDIGPAVVEAIGRFFGEPHNIGMVDSAHRATDHPGGREAGAGFPGSQGSPWSSPDRSRR